MRSVLRVMAASSLIVMAYATEVSAQTGFRNMFDHLHLAAPDPIKAVEWYRKNLAGQPTTEGTDRLMFGETRVIFQRNEERQGDDRATAADASERCIHAACVHRGD